MITDYGTLKSEIRSYLYNRKDLEDRIPSFISLAERKIFRVLRIPNMEVLLVYEPFDLGDGADPIGYSQLELPGDFLEAKFLLGNDRPLERISDIEIQAKLNRRPAPRETAQFARVGNRLLLYPVSDDPKAIFTLSYWRDYSGTLVNDEDTHDVLRVAPDLFLYGSMLESASWMVGDSRIPVWQALYDQSLAQLIEHYKQAEYAGSNVSVSSAGGGNFSDSSYYPGRYY